MTIPVIPQSRENQHIEPTLGVSILMTQVYYFSSYQNVHTIFFVSHSVFKFFVSAFVKAFKYFEIHFPLFHTAFILTHVFVKNGANC